MAESHKDCPCVEEMVLIRILNQHFLNGNGIRSQNPEKKIFEL